MENKQTSIDWLVEQLYLGLSENGLKSVINQAKEMHKQEIIDAYKNGVDGTLLAEQYYNDTYGK